MKDARTPRVAALLAMVAASAALSANAESFICVADKATGFAYKGRSWESVDFDVADAKYILNKEGNAWTWKALGKEGLTSCEGDFNVYGLLWCREVYQVVINRNTLRFQSYYPVGYVGVSRTVDTGTDTPAITIGRCSKV